MANRFPVIDTYLGTILDSDISNIQPGVSVVKESSRRLRCEKSYSFVHALYGIIFSDGRVVISVTPGAGSGVVALMDSQQPDFWKPFEQDWLDDLAACVRQARVQAGFLPSKEASESLIFACNQALVRQYDQGDCRRLTDERIPAAADLIFPTHCFPDGLVYGIVQDHQIVSVAYAHKTNIMEEQVADLGVETSAAYRKRGYARHVVSAVTAQITSSGGEAIYTCSKDNLASIATASSVGYELYGRRISIAAPAN